VSAGSRSYRNFWGRCMGKLNWGHAILIAIWKAAVECFNKVKNSRLLILWLLMVLILFIFKIIYKRMRKNQIKSVNYKTKAIIWSMTSKEIILTWRSSLYKNVSGHTDNNNLLKVRDKFLNEVSNQALWRRTVIPATWKSAIQRIMGK
jgi:hypothetical protein